MKFKSIIFISSLLVGMSTSCTDSLDVIDTKNISQEEVDDVLGRNPSAITYGIYSRTSEFAFDANSHDDFGQKSLDLSNDIMTEDIVHYSNQQFFVFDYNLDNNGSTFRRARRQWKYCYANISDANTVINNIPVDTEDPNLLNMKGEALALRAYHYFMLINTYQTAGDYELIKSKPGVPLYTELVLGGAPRGTVADVYNMIHSDLDLAIELLEGSSFDNTRMGLTVAKAIKARAAMYVGDYKTAAEMASVVIDKTPLMSNKDYQSGFNSINLSECIWGASINNENSTSYASFFSMIDNYSPGYAGALKQYKCIDKRLYDSMNPNDVRKGCFANEDSIYTPRVDAAALALAPLAPYIAAKFVDTEGSFVADYIYMRVAEMYYIKAESQARLGNETAAKATLDVISNHRAVDGNHTYVWASGQALLDQIFYHYRFENWGEGMILFEYNRLMKPIDRTYVGTNHPIGNIVGGDVPVLWNNSLRTIKLPNSEIEGNPEISLDDQNK